MNENINGSGYRSFGGIDCEDDVAVPVEESSQKLGTDKKLQALRSEIIGNYHDFQTPYGTKSLVYADWTASGRGLVCVEQYIQREVLQLYGNTHTTTSITGHQSTCFRHESRQIVAESTNAKITGKASEDVVLFTGNGTTSAVNKLIASLNLNTPLPEGMDENLYRPVVFTSSYEHHSNLLPWRESVADVVSIAYHPGTGVDLEDLAAKLLQYQQRKLKIGAFSAASNVTGILTDVDRVSILMHKAGGLVFYDYATAAPYVKMDMNPVIYGDDSPFVYKDGMFFSGHKFIGGPGSPGVLIVKKKLLPPSDTQPTAPGGGTVFYVTEDHHRYLSNREEREESGTPDIIGDIRLGLILHLKATIGVGFIETEELRIGRYVLEKLKTNEKILVLGSGSDTKRLPIVSFLIRCGERFLHYNFVCALLNDLFGVQSRGGCQCAGPFSHSLLGLSLDDSRKIELALLDKHEVFRPGYSRLSFPYWLSMVEINYILNAISFVGDNGWKFLPYYRYNHRTGEWAHTTRLTKFPERKWLSNCSLLVQGQAKSNQLTQCKDDLEICRCLEAMTASAELELASIENSLLKRKTGGLGVSVSAGGEDISGLDEIRWFVFSDDVSSTSAAALTEVLKGPIQPKILSCKEYSDDIETDVINQLDTDRHTIVSAEASLYAQKRHKRLRARVGGENQAPRYLSFESKVVDSSILPSNSSLKKKRNDISSVISNSGDEISSKKDSSITDNTTSFSSEKQFDKNLEKNSSLESDEAICTTGSCFIPRKVTSVAETLGGAPVLNTKEGKRLSGPGTVYQPGPSEKPTLQPSVVPKKILKLVGQAVKDWSMIQEGDRLLLGLSGGKDSLCLLHVLLALQKRAPVRFEIGCATVDPQTASYDPTPLIPYLRSLGVTYHYLSEPIVELAKTKLQGDSLCAFCARFKRGLLYSCCRNFKYNKLVLGQHLDDLAESFLMSALHNGQIRTMKANYSINAGDIRVIRPLVYVREKQTRDFSVGAKLPIINENCPACFEQPKERARLKKLLLQEESMVPMLYFNLKKGLLPLMHEKTYEVMANVASEIEANNKVFRGRVPLPAKENNEDDNDESTTTLATDAKGFYDDDDTDISGLQFDSSIEKDSQLSKRFKKESDELFD